jgi:hypothetical protein
MALPAHQPTPDQLKYNAEVSVFRSGIINFMTKSGGYDHGEGTTAHVFKPEVSALGIKNEGTDAFVMIHSEFPHSNGKRSNRPEIHLIINEYFRANEECATNSVLITQVFVSDKNIALRALYARSEADVPEDESELAVGPLISVKPGVGLSFSKSELEYISRNITPDDMVFNRSIGDMIDAIKFGRRILGLMDPSCLPPDDLPTQYATEI